MCVYEYSAVIGYSKTQLCSSVRLFNLHSEYQVYHLVILFGQRHRDNQSSAKVIILISTRWLNVVLFYTVSNNLKSIHWLHCVCTVFVSVGDTKSCYFTLWALVMISWVLVVLGTLCEQRTYAVHLEVQVRLWYLRTYSAFWVRQDLNTWKIQILSLLGGVHQTLLFTARNLNVTAESVIKTVEIDDVLAFMGWSKWPYKPDVLWQNISLLEPVFTCDS